MKQPLGVYLCLLLLASTAFAAPLDPQDNAAVREKANRTVAQRKIDSQLLYAIYRERGEAKIKGAPAGDLRVTLDKKRRALVSIRARVTKDLLALVKTLGGDVVSWSERDHDIRAYLPLGKLEELAASKTVNAIAPAEEATTNRAK